MAKYLLTPCLSSPRTRASAKVASTSFGNAPTSIARTSEPAPATMRARSRMARVGSFSCAGLSIAFLVLLRGHGRLQDRVPAGNVGLEHFRQRARSAIGLRRHGTAEIDHALLQRRIVERLVERSGELVDDRLRGAFRGEDRAPDIDGKVRVADFLRRRHVRDRR